MEKYIEVKNIITSICNQSGLSPIELSGVLNECLAGLRYAMLTNAVAETMQVKEELQKAKEAEQSGIEHE